MQTVTVATPWPLALQEIAYRFQRAHFASRAVLPALTDFDLARSLSDWRHAEIARPVVLTPSVERDATEQLTISLNLHSTLVQAAGAGEGGTGHWIHGILDEGNGSVDAFINDGLEERRSLECCVRS